MHHFLPLRTRRDCREPLQIVTCKNYAIEVICLALFDPVCLLRPGANIREEAAIS